MNILYEYDEEKQREFDREEGMELGLITLIQKKIEKGKALDVIVEELETTTDEIKPIYDAIMRYPDSKPKEILSRI